MRTGRLWPLLLLLYVVIDFSDPSIPGVFFFETDQLFVEAAVTLAKATPAPVMPVASPRSVESGRSRHEPSGPPPRAFRSPGRHTDLRARQGIGSDSLRDASGSISSEDD